MVGQTIKVCPELGRFTLVEGRNEVVSKVTAYMREEGEVQSQQRHPLLLYIIHNC